MFTTIQQIRNQHGQCSLNMTSEMRHQNKSRIRQIIIHTLRRLILYRIHTSLLISAMQSLVGISRNWTQLYSFRMSGSEFHNMHEGRKECGTYQIKYVCTNLRCFEHFSIIRCHVKYKMFIFMSFVVNMENLAEILEYPQTEMIFGSLWNVMFPTKSMFIARNVGTLNNLP